MRKIKEVLHPLPSATTAEHWKVLLLQPESHRPVYRVLLVHKTVYSLLVQFQVHTLVRVHQESVTIDESCRFVCILPDTIDTPAGK
ncbi:MAG: hypothetical protein ACREDR_01260 [Blastocatellia bacterium]